MNIKWLHLKKNPLKRFCKLNFGVILKTKF